MGMTPVLPDSTRLSQAPTVTQVHQGRTSGISSTAFPVLVNTNSCLTSCPGGTLPKSNIGASNSIRGAAGGEGPGASEPLVCAEPEAITVSMAVPATRIPDGEIGITNDE